jgi:hypothetical protein
VFAVADGPKQYDQAGCASGCRDTMAGTAALIALVAVLSVRLVRRGRRGRR